MILKQSIIQMPAIYFRSINGIGIAVAIRTNWCKLETMLSSSRNYSGRYRSSAIYRRYSQEKVDNKNASGPKPGIDTNRVHGSYKAQLFDKRWLEKRTLILARDGGSCKLCTSTSMLQVHHRQYHFVLAENRFKSPWDYEDHLLITLCESCHKRSHNLYKIPIFNI